MEYRARNTVVLFLLPPPPPPEKKKTCSFYIKPHISLLLCYSIYITCFAAFTKSGISYISYMYNILVVVSSSNPSTVFEVSFGEGGGGEGKRLTMRAVCVWRRTSYVTPYVTHLGEPKKASVAFKRWLTSFSTTLSARCRLLCNLKRDVQQARRDEV